jgi:hypothetical protein
MKRFRGLVAGIGSVAVAASVAGAQLTPVKPTPLPIPVGPQVGDAAPDFSLPGATRYGLLKTPVHLSDFRGSTVVLAFFYQARTKG